jgi:hypothetical protein
MMQVAGPGGQAPTVVIVVPASVATGTLLNMRELARELSRIVVDRYLLEVGLTESTLKSSLQAMPDGAYGRDVFTSRVVGI